jgi:PAS domain S-box-containing protein
MILRFCEVDVDSSDSVEREPAAQGTASTDAPVALGPSRMPFDVLADVLPALVFVADAHGHPVYMNRRIAEFTGLGRTDLLGQGWPQMLHPDDRERARRLWAHAVAAEVPYEAEYRIRRRDGDYRLFLCRGSLHRDAHGEVEYWVATCTDVEEHRRAEATLRIERTALERTIADRTQALAEAGRQLAEEITRRDAAQARALHAQKLEALGVLSGSIAHDFNNILAGISGAVNLLTRAGLSAEHEHYLDFARRGVERGTYLVRQLVGFARSEGPVPKAFDVAEMLEATLALIRQALGGGTELEVDAAPGLTVLADPQQFELAVLNLAMNARDAMGGTGRIRIEATASHAGDPEHPARMAEDAVRITVCDSGAGMPPEVLARATEPFFTTKPRGQGTGLGLPMVRGFADQARGVLKIDSAVGQGTRVTIILPRITAVPLAHAMVEPPLERERHGRATIMVVEDDDLVRPMLCGYLRDLGYTVVEARDGMSAYALAHALPRLDAIVTDVVLPHMDGPALAQRLRAERDVPVLFVSGNAERALLFGERVLEKPFSQAVFAEHVLRTLGRKDASAERGSSDEMREHCIRIRRRVRDADMLGCLRVWAEHWEENAVPLLAALTPGEPCASHAFVARRETADAGVQYRVISMGHLLSEAAEGNLSALVSAVPGGPFSALGSAYERAARTRLPSYECLQLGDPSGGGDAVTLFERLLLPVRDGSDAAEPTHVLGIVNAVPVRAHRAPADIESIQQQHEDAKP